MGKQRRGGNNLKKSSSSLCTKGLPHEKKCLLFEKDCIYDMMSFVDLFYVSQYSWGRIRSQSLADFLVV